MSAGKPSGANLFTQNNIGAPLRPPINNQENRTNNLQPTSSGIKATTGDVGMNTRINVPRKRGESGAKRQYFHPQSMENYFADLHRNLIDTSSCQKVRNDLLNSANLKKWLRQALDDFGPNKMKQQIFEKEYKNKPFLNLKPHDVGFGRATLSNSPHSQKIDLILNKVIQIMSTELNSNGWMVTKAIRKYLKLGQFYPSLYQSEIGNSVFKPNLRVIERYFSTADQNTINQSSLEFQIILVKCLEMYFDEYHKCIFCLPYFLNYRLSVINQRPIGLVLWDSYCNLADTLLPKQTKDEGKEAVGVLAVRKKCRQFIINKKVVIFQFLVKFFHRAVSNDESLAIEVAGLRQRFSETTILKIDRNISDIERSSRFSSMDVNNLTLQLTELMLALFPWRQFYNSTGSIGFQRSAASQQKEWNEIIKRTESIAIRPLRVLFLMQGKDLIQQINSSLINGDWSVHSYQWKNWLGIFLQKIKGIRKERLIGRYPKVLKYLIWLCKIVVKQEYDMFWDVVDTQMIQRGRSQMEESRVAKIRPYMTEIYHFINEIKRNPNPQKYDVKFQDILPILTASLGTIHQNYVMNLTGFIGLEQFTRYITDKISQALNLQEKQVADKSRIVYSIEDKDRNIEQEIKLLCRMVQLCHPIHQLDAFVETRQTYGLSLAIYLGKILNKLVPETAQDVKCFRYIIKAFDAIFVNKQTRYLLAMALGVIQVVNKLALSKTVKQIVNLCLQPSGTSQYNRQCVKLREVIDTHILNVLKMSNSMSEYFPSKTLAMNEKKYEKLEKYLRQSRLQDIYIQFINVEDPPLKVIPWINYFLLILQNNKLTMLQLQIVHELVLKLRIDQWATKEYPGLQLAVDLINKGQLKTIITNILTPTIKTDKNNHKALFDLTNAHYQGKIVQTQNTQAMLKSSSNAPKYASRNYRLSKLRQQNQSEITTTYQQISSCLRIIETVLRLNLEGQFKLIDKLNFNQWIMNSLVDKGHFFTVKFTVKLEESKREKQLRHRSREKTYVEQELTASVNLIHTIASLLDFQDRFSIEANLHPSINIKPNGPLIFDSQGLGNTNIYTSIVVKNHFSLLSQWPTKDSISVSVLRIIQHLLALGFDKQVYFGICNRVYPQNKVMTTKQPLDQFLNTLLSIISRPTTGIRARQTCLQFLCTTLKNHKFSQNIRAVISKFRQPFLTCIDFIQNQGGLQMIVHLLLFLNILLTDQPKGDDLRFVRACLGDIQKFGYRLINISRQRFKHIEECPDNSKVQKMLIWSRHARDGLMCKLSLMLYLGITAAMLTNQPYFTARLTCEFILSEASLFLDSVLPIKLELLDQLSHQETEKILKKADKQIDKGYLQFTQDLLQNMLFDIQGSFGEDYACRRWEVYHRAVEDLEIKGNIFIVRALQINMKYSLQISQEMLSQFYCSIISGLFQRGAHGFYFLQGNPQHSKKFTHLLSCGDHAPNNLSGWQIISSSDKFINNCIIIIKILIKDLWQNINKNDLMFCKGNEVLLLAQMFKIIAKLLTDDPIKAGQYASDVRKLLEKVEAHVACGGLQRVGERGLMILIQGQLHLFQSLFIQSRLNNLSLQSIRSYLASITQIFQHSLPKLQPSSVLKLLHIIFDQQLTNILTIQEMPKELNSYFTCHQRSEMQKKVSQSLQTAMKIIEDRESSEELKILALQLFSKMLQIYFVGKGFGSKDFREFQHRLSTKLENMAEDQGSMVLVSGLFAAELISEATAINPNQWMRVTARILTAKNGLIIDRISRCGSAQSLQAVLQAKIFFSTLCNISTQQNWKNQQVGSVLSKTFTNIQQHAQQFLQNQVVPITQGQSDLASRVLIQKLDKRSNKYFERKVFSIIAELRVYEMLRNFLLFMLSALKNCPLFFQFCNKTITNKPFNEQTWDRLKLTLENACDFMIRFADTLKLGMPYVLAVNSSICKEVNFANLTIRAFFQDYADEQDIIQDVLNTIAILTECIQVLVAVWRTYDWKSRLDWSPFRKSLVSKGRQMLLRWNQLAARIDCEALLRERALMLDDTMSHNNSKQ